MGKNNPANTRKNVERQCLEMYEISYEHLRKIIDSITVIRGNAQLAMEVSHVKWARNYLNEIKTECDKLNLLVGEVIKKKL